jgi:hypothetical protein
MTLVCVMQSAEKYLPGRVLRLVSQKVGSLVLKAEENGKLVVECRRNQDAAGKVSIKSKDVDCRKPCIAILRWDAASQDLSLRVKSVGGERFVAEPVKAAPFETPLRSLEIGKVADLASSLPAAANEQFHGHMAELLLYRKPLSDSDLDEIERQLSEHYFEK